MAGLLWAGRGLSSAELSGLQSNGDHDASFFSRTARDQDGDGDGLDRCLCLLLAAFASPETRNQNIFVVVVTPHRKVSACGVLLR